MKKYIISICLGLMLLPCFSSAASVSYPNGTLIRAEGDSKVFVVHNNKKRWLRNEAIFESYANSWGSIKVLSKTEVDAIPYNNLIRSDGVMVYALNDIGYKRHIFNPDIFGSYGLSWADIADINTTEFTNYPDCNLIKQDGDQKVYFIDGDTKRWITSTNAFSANNFNWDAIQTINSTDANHYKIGVEITINVNVNVNTPAVLSINGITPNQAVNTAATNVVITGTNFKSGATAKIGLAYSITNVAVVNSTTITGNIPANIPAGVYNLIVTNYDGNSVTLTNAFTVSNSTPTPTFSIQATANANGTISPSGSVSVTQGTDKTFTITPSSGYAIASVVVDGINQGAISSYTFTNVAVAHTITVSFSLIIASQFIITVDQGANGTISPSGPTTVDRGTNKTFTITPSSGYVVSSVTVDGINQGAISSYTFTNVQSAHTISATFSLIIIYSNSWTTGASGGTARWGHASVEYNGKIYSWGGINRDNEPLNTMDIYDIVSDSWSSGAVGGTKRQGHTAVVYNGKIYFWGGASANGGVRLASMEIYDITTNTWSTGADGPAARYEHSSVLYNGKIYSWGGDGYGESDYLNSLVIYDIATNAWSTGTSGGIKRAYHESILYNGKMYSWGGIDWYANRLNSLDIYNIATDTWSTGVSGGTARNVYASIVYGDKIYSFGGQTGQSGINLNSLDIYNIATNTWSTGTPGGMGRSGHTAVQYNGKIYLWGGNGGSDNLALNSLDICSL